MKTVQPMMLALTLAFGIGLFFAAPGARAQTAMIDGEVMRVDQSASKITLKHGPIKKLGMDMGMTMVFGVREPALLTAVKIGDHVKFDAERINGQFVVTKLEKAK
jgi:Cu/Ag efflux protein CusF